MKLIPREDILFFNQFNEDAGIDVLYPKGFYYAFENDESYGGSRPYQIWIVSKDFFRQENCIFDCSITEILVRFIPTIEKYLDESCESCYNPTINTETGKYYTKTEIRDLLNPTGYFTENKKIL